MGQMAGMTKTLWAIAALSGIGVAAFACSGGNPYSPCVAGQANQLGSGCYACLQDSCGTELGTYESACNDYIGCSCPGGSYSASAASSASCQKDESESGWPPPMAAAGPLRQWRRRSLPAEELRQSVLLGRQLRRIRKRVGLGIRIGIRIGVRIRIG